MFNKNFGLAKWGILFHMETHFVGKLVSIFFKLVMKHITCNTKVGEIRSICKFFQKKQAAVISKKTPVTRGYFRN